MTAALYPLTCSVCGNHFLGKQRNFGLNIFCSKKCASFGKRATMRNLGGLSGVLTLTERNRETTLRWLACQKAGTHQPGATLTGTRTWRGHDAPMPVCDTCTVPFPDESVGFRVKGSLSGYAEDAA